MIALHKVIHSKEKQIKNMKIIYRGAVKKTSIQKKESIRNI